MFYKKYLGAISKERALRFEDKVTVRYMKKYGLNNVRGGSLSMKEDLVEKFGRYYLLNDWKVIITVSAMVAGMLYLLVIYYLKP